MAGVNQVIMLALSMAVIGGMVGAPGLGLEVTRAISTIDIGLGFESGLSVVVLAIYLDRVTAGVGNRTPGAGPGKLGRLLRRRPKPAGDAAADEAASATGQTRQEPVPG